MKNRIEACTAQNNYTMSCLCNPQLWPKDVYFLLRLPGVSVDIPGLWRCWWLGSFLQGKVRTQAINSGLICTSGMQILAQSGSD